MHTAHTPLSTRSSLPAARAHTDVWPGLAPESAPAPARVADTPARASPGHRPYDSLVTALHRVARRIGAHDSQAEAQLSALMSELARHPDPRCVGLYVFSAGLARRVSGLAVAQANLYLGRFEVPQIHLFNLLGRAVPFVGLATRICNQAIQRAMRLQARPTLVDVGIGTGRQACVLLQSMAEAGELPELLTVIGIEPAGWALEEARQCIEQTARSLDAQVNFVAIEGTAEALTPAQWHHLAQACTAQPVVNASFALHHIGDGPNGEDQRNPVLAQLMALNPALLVLAEPDVDHLETHFYTRFRHCMTHFGAVFDTLDRLPLAQADRDALKVGFFGREIGDILGTPEGQRSERHESAHQWQQRLQHTGFELCPAPAQPDPALAAAAAVHIRQHASHTSLDASDGPVVALFLARPRAPAAAH